MQQRRRFRFDAQPLWAKRHTEMRQILELDRVPDRATHVRRYKILYGVVQDFIAFLGHSAKDPYSRFTSKDLDTDKNPFKAPGAVWHPCERQAGRLHEKLRHLDPDASPSQSGYHIGFSKLVQVATATASETLALDHQAEQIVHAFELATLTSDNRYDQGSRMRQGAEPGVVFLSSVVKGSPGRYAIASYHGIEQPAQRQLMQRCRTAIAPMFDLVAHALSPTGRQKQWAMQRLGMPGPAWRSRL